MVPAAISPVPKSVPSRLSAFCDSVPSMVVPSASVPPSAAVPRLPATSPYAAESPHVKSQLMFWATRFWAPAATLAVKTMLSTSVELDVFTSACTMLIFPEISFLVSLLVCSAFCCSSSAVLMMIVEATAATRIRAMKTIIAPIPMEPSSRFLSTVWYSSLIACSPVPPCEC